MNTLLNTAILSPSEAGRIAVLMGGNNSEREVSLMSGAGVLAALLERGYQAEKFDPAVDDILTIKKFDRVFNILHGGNGENGAIQGFLEVLGLPYSGPGILASALGMNKLRCKQIWQQAGIPITPYCSVLDESQLAEVIALLGLPLFVKPSSEGSSVGISKVKSAEELYPAFHAAKKYDNTVLIEAAVNWKKESMLGGEYSLPIVNGQCLPLIKITPTTEFYDYQAKYFRDDTQYLCPCPHLPPALVKAIEEDALNAFAAIEGSGWSRVDVLINDEGKHYILEINTSPGMTSHSLVPIAAKSLGLSYSDLVLIILSLSYER